MTPLPSPPRAIITNTRALVTKERKCEANLDDSLKVELCAIPQGELATLSAGDTAPPLWRPS